MYNDLTIHKGLLFGSVTIDTIKEVITITNIDPKALSEIETNITEIMINQKPCLYEIDALLFDYTDKENEFNEFICFLVHRTKYF
jgi:hypothetical protein